MKTVVRNNNKEEAEVQDTWYALIAESELECLGFTSSLYPNEDEAFDIASEAYDETMYVAEVKLITKVVG